MVVTPVTDIRCCRRVHAQYKELLRTQETKTSLLKAAHGIDQQRALAVSCTFIASMSHSCMQ